MKERSALRAAMAKEISIRQASLKDIPVILHHRRAMFFEMGKSHRSGLDAMTRAARAYLRKTIAQGTYKGWLAETMEGKIVAGSGLAILTWPPVPSHPHPKRVVIYNVYTEPSYRRRGLARRLMVKMIEWCRARGFAYAFLHASDDGRPLYDSLGFEATNEMRLSLKSTTRRNRIPIKRPTKRR